MKCLKCGIEMLPGIAIKTNTEVNALYIICQPMINAETLELIDVLKCPMCGYSNDGVEE